MDKVTKGSQRIVEVLLDNTDKRPVWIQAWGGTNTIARALKTIEETYPERMAEVADKMRLFLIWEQDSTYQAYIRPHWKKYNIKTIISDQFEAIAYRWKMVQPDYMQKYYEGAWMKENILQNHGALCGSYKAHDNGDFRSEGDSPAFLHTINVGLRNLENPSWGGWGGRYVLVRENTWLDPVPVEDISILKAAGMAITAGGDAVFVPAALPPTNSAALTLSRCGDGALQCRTILRPVPIGASSLMQMPTISLWLCWRIVPT